jgi:hypothetical protein
MCDLNAMPDFGSMNNLLAPSLPEVPTLIDEMLNFQMKSAPPSCRTA